MGWSLATLKKCCCKQPSTPAFPLPTPPSTSCRKKSTRTNSPEVWRPRAIRVDGDEAVCGEAAGGELFSVLTARKLLILHMARGAKKAPLPILLYVYCTKIFSHYDS